MNSVSHQTNGTSRTNGHEVVRPVEPQQDETEAKIQASIDEGLPLLNEDIADTVRAARADLQRMRMMLDSLAERDGSEESLEEYREASLAASRVFLALDNIEMINRDGGSLSRDGKDKA